MKKIIIFLYAVCFLFDYSVAQTYQLPNGGFENWEGSGTSAEPTHWSSFMTGSGSGLAFSFGQNQQISLSTDVRPGTSGTKSVRLYAKEIMGVIANGIITTGQVNMASTTPSDPSNHTITRRASAAFNQPLSAKPDSIRFWCKFNCPSSTQKARMNAVIHDSYDYMDPDSYDGNAPRHVVGKALAEFTRGTQTWTEYLVPFNYNFQSSTPSYILITFATNRTPGEGSSSDQLFIDDISFIYNPRLSNINVAGNSIPGFDPEVTQYNVTVYGETPLTTITVTTASPNATYQITQPTPANPVGIIRVNNGDATNTYYVYFTYVNSSSNLVYVAPPPLGNDANDGSATTPFASLQQALAFASSDSATRIIMAVGTYQETQILELKSNITIDGGYTPSDTSDWTKSGGTSTIQVNSLEYIGDYSHKIGFRSVADSNWTIRDITLNIPSATTADRAPSGKGATVYGIYMMGTTAGNRMENCNIVVGNGGSGQNGVSGQNGSNGNNGGAGGSGGLSPLTNSGLEVGTGGAAVGSGQVSGGGGGAGSAGGEGYHGTSNAGAPGYMGGAYNGGAGGNGGAGVSYTVNGKVGSPGANGPNGVTVPANAQYNWSTYFIPAAQGGNGTDGFGGGGGGGGSGGGGATGQTLFINNQYCGGAGGGGGSGGTAGRGGTGGFGGGGSFGIYCFATFTPELLNTRITVGNPGSGGTGGSGGSGGTGGSGGSGGGCSSTGNAGNGGAGGRGGNGGRGGIGENGITGAFDQIVIIDQNSLIKENISCPIVEDVVFCANDSIILKAIPGFNGNTCRWYSSDSSLTILNVDTIFTPHILGDTVFYVATFDSLHSNESLERIPLFVRVNPQPAIPLISDVHRCEIGVVNLSAIMGLNATTCYWYSSLDSVIPMVTGTFYSDSISETTTYYISGVNENTGCESPIIPIVASLGFHSDTTLFQANICRGEDYVDNGFELLNQSASNTYFLLFENSTGCDSIVRLDLIVNPHSDSTIFDTIYKGSAYTENGFNIEVQEDLGTQFFQNNLENEFSCDSTIFLYLTVIEDNSGVSYIRNQGVRIYPNPASTLLYIALESTLSEEVQKITIFDIYGKLLFRISTNEQLITFDLSGYASGVYVLKIDTPKGQLTQKIIKK